MLRKGFTCILYTNNFLVGRYWDFNFFLKDTTWDATKYTQRNNVSNDNYLFLSAKCRKKNRGKYHSVDISEKKQKGLLAEQETLQEGDTDCEDYGDYISGSEANSDDDDTSGNAINET